MTINGKTPVPHGRNLLWITPEHASPEVRRQRKVLPLGLSWPWKFVAILLVVWMLLAIASITTTSVRAVMADYAVPQHFDCPTRMC